MADFTQSPGSLNIKLVFGDTFSTLLTFSNGASAYSLVGYTIVAKTETTNTSFTITPYSDYSDGKIYMSLTATQSAGLANGEKWYMTFTNGASVQTMITGVIVELAK